MPLIQNLLRALRPAGVERVYCSEAVRGVMGKSVEDLYSEQPHLRTVTDFIAQNVASLPLKCYMRNADADRERDTTGALPRLLRNPNPDMSGFDLIYATVLEWCLYGRAIWLVGRDSASDSGWQVRLIPVSWVSAWEGGDGFSFERLRFSDPNAPSAPVTVSTSECVMFTAYRPGKPAGACSPVESLRQTLAEQVEAQEFRRSVWRNSTRISGYITRPKDAPGWNPAAAARFKKDMRENWGAGGSRSGGTPVLEDGMEYRAVKFDAHESDWTGGVQLSREDVAAAYHVNPAIIWAGNGQTYASAKDNARALYADTLSPLLRMLSERINKVLAPMIGAPESEYTEFDLTAKLQASFEERASAMQTAVGGPWMTREEARAAMNLPKKPVGELIVPLNVLTGGLASPTDTAPKDAPHAAGGDTRPKAHDGACACSACAGLKSAPAPRGRKASGHPDDTEAEAYRDVLARFYAHQRKVVLTAIGAKSGRKADGTPAWWDADRWNKELAEDLAEAVNAGADAAAKRALESLGIDPALYDTDRTRAFLLALAKARAEMVNAGTLEQLEAAIAGELGEGAQGSTPAGVFDKAEGSRAEQQAHAIAAAVAGWAIIEAARQCAPSTTTKTWLTTSRNPRPSHARINGETVPVSKRFSNGADWPGDSRVLPVGEVANCRCEVELTVPDDGDGGGDDDIEVTDKGARMPGYWMPRGKFDYCLRRDENKARAFEAALGYNPDNWQDLAREVLEWHKGNDPEYRDETEYGKRYTSNMLLTGKTGKETKVLAGWILENGANDKRLTTLHVDK